MIIFDSFCVFLLEHFDVLWMYLLLSAMFDKIFAKDSKKTSTFMTKLSKRQEIGSILPSTKNNKPIPIEIFKPNKLKE